MAKPATFDMLAPAYDHAFSHSLVGEQQRHISRKWLQRFLTGKKNLHILEINCGTGEDAQWLAGMGHTVTATDASAAMIQAGQQKTVPADTKHNPRYMVCSFEQLSGRFQQQQFDLIFSNFSGLNCVDPDGLLRLDKQLHGLLNNNGYLAIVIFGKYTWWESFYFLLKGQTRNAFRRWTNKKVMVPLAENTEQPVYYYSSRHFENLLHSFRKMERRPVGLFVPPSYLEKLMQKNQRVFKLLVALDKIFGAIPSFSGLADHTYMLFKKETT